MFTKLFIKKDVKNMYILLLIFMLVSIACFIPKYKLYTYINFAIIVLAFTLFFFWPDNTYDLYRHFLTLKRYSELSFFQIINIEPRNLGKELADVAVSGYIKNYPIFSTLSWIISKIGLYQLLPVSVVWMTYYLAVKRLKFVALKNQDTSKIIISIWGLILLSYNFVFISSNLRQPLASSIFAYAVYEEFVNKKNKMECYIIYILPCFIHSIGYLFLGMRLIFQFYNQYTKWIIYLGLLFSNKILFFVCSYVEKTNDGPLAIAADKFLRYSLYRNNNGVSHISYKLLALYSILFIIILLFQSISKKSSQYEKYSKFIICNFLFTFAMTNQSEIFNRFEFLILPLILPIIHELISEWTGHKLFSIKTFSKKARFFQIVLVGFSLIILLNFGIASYKNYAKTTSHFSIENFMQNGDLNMPWR